MAKATRAEIAAARTDSELEALRVKYDYTQAFINRLKESRKAKERGMKWNNARYTY